MCTIHIYSSGWLIQTPNKVSTLLNLNKFKLCFYYLDRAMWLNLCYHSYQRSVMNITCKISDKSNNINIMYKSHLSKY